MRWALWLSLIPLTGFWLFNLGIYGPSLDPKAALIMLLAGICLSIIGFWKAEVSWDKRIVFAATPMAISSLVIPSPYNTGLIIASIALFLAFVSIGTKALWFKGHNIRGHWIWAILLGGLFTGITLGFQALVLAMYYITAPSHHDFGELAPILSFASNLTGLAAASNEGIIFVYGLGQTYPITITLEKLGFYPWILIFSGALILIGLASQNRSEFSKRLFGMVSVSALYLCLRFVVLLHLFFATDMPPVPIERMEIFTGSIWLLASFAPLVFILAGLYSSSNTKLDFRLDFELKLNKKNAIGTAALFIGLFAIAGAALFQDPGIEKDGRVLVDEIHSVWEFSTLALDKEWYGTNSTYNAYNMIEWLDQTYDVDRIVSHSYDEWQVPGVTKVAPEIVSDKITPEILDGYDILIIKTPSRYKPEEVEAIRDFVKKGGGLFLIGDHTNFAGSGTNLNQISRNFGIEFGFDSVNTQDGRLYTYERGHITHPCERYMTHFDFMTGCSIKAPLRSEPVMLGFGLGAVPGEYASTGFFRETRRNDPTQVTDTTWGLIYQTVALKYGKGRIVAFSDSTTISNFRIFFGGTPNLIAGCMEYLNKSNRYEYGRHVLLLLGVIFSLCGAYFLSGKRVPGESIPDESARGKRRMAALTLILALAALSASGALLTFSSEVEDSIPCRYYDKNSTICFEVGHSGPVVTSKGEHGDYETFFIWTQRVNFTPSLERDLEKAMAKGRVLVIIDPTKPFSGEEVASIQEYVREGNSVLMMIDSKDPDAGSELIRSFGMNVHIVNETINQKNQTVSNQVSDLAGDKLPINPAGLGIMGGTKLLTAKNRTVLAEVNHNDGKFVLFAESHIFKDGLGGRPGYMGSSKSDPSIGNLGYDLGALYDLEFQIFEEVLGP